MRKYIQINAIAILFWAGVIVAASAPSFLIGCVGALIAWASSRIGDNLLNASRHE